MTGFEPGSSAIGSDRSANCATTTALIYAPLYKGVQIKKFNFVKF